MSNYGTLLIYLTIFPCAGVEGNHQRTRRVLLLKLHAITQDRWKEVFADFIASNELLKDTEMVRAEWRCDPESMSSYDLQTMQGYRA
jgi:uncharacterized protein (DUF3084 family)